MMMKKKKEDDDTHKTNLNIIHISTTKTTTRHQQYDGDEILSFNVNKCNEEMMVRLLVGVNMLIHLMTN